MTPDRETLKPYMEWVRQGRTVRGGQKAEWYLVSPDGKHGIALFHEDQTDQLYEQDTTHWHDLVARDEWKAAPPKGAARIKVRANGRGLAVWVGSNRPAIAILKRAGWRFDRFQNRWVMDNRDMDRFVSAMESEGFEVQVDA